jgi:Zn-finger protein
MNYNHFINFRCEFLPCHDLTDWHSCLFCYCPLFLLSCPGDFTILPSGMKDCSACTIPHTEKGWDIMQEELRKQIYDRDPSHRRPR